MISQLPDTTMGLLLSGGLDSAILLGHLLERGERVQPIYVRSGFVWQDEELRAAQRLYQELIQRLSHTRLARSSHGDRAQRADLVVLEMPVTDLYHEHWSVTGRDTPDAQSPDEAVYMPGHNPLLLIKAILWCHMQGVTKLALASLASNPFSDATEEFFEPFQEALSQAIGGKVHVIRPFDRHSKQQVMQLGEGYPLELTFSCLAPQGELHCGRCNKCAERKAAFRCLPTGDPTRYARCETSMCLAEGTVGN